MKKIKNFLGNINGINKHFDKDIDMEIECLKKNKKIEKFILKNNIKKEIIVKNMISLIKYNQMDKTFENNNEFEVVLELNNENIKTLLKIKEKYKYLYDTSDILDYFLDIDTEIILLIFNKIKKDEKKYLNKFLECCCSSNRIKFLEFIMQSKKNNSDFENIFLISNNENSSFFIAVYLLWIFLKKRNRIIFADFNVLERDFKYGPFNFKEQIIKKIIKVDILLLIDFSLDSEEKIFNNILLNRTKNNKINIIFSSKELSTNSYFNKFSDLYELLYLQ